jgi:hypothetical protein
VIVMMMMMMKENKEKVKIVHETNKFGDVLNSYRRELEQLTSKIYIYGYQLNMYFKCK